MLKVFPMYCSPNYLVLLVSCLPTMKALTVAHCQTGVMVGSLATTLVFHFYLLNNCTEIGDDGLFVDKEDLFGLLLLCFPLLPVVPLYAYVVVAHRGITVVNLSLLGFWTPIVVASLLLVIHLMLLLGTIFKSPCLMLPWLTSSIFLWVSDFVLRGLIYWEPVHGRTSQFTHTSYLWLSVAGTWILPGWLIFNILVLRLYHCYKYEESIPDLEDV